MKASEIFSWDVKNWSRVLPLWEEYGGLDSSPMRCLELGAEEGGLSLWLASKGHHVLCTDLKSLETKAGEFHQTVDYSGSISYQVMDATQIPFEEAFDIIIFKSILGGIGRDGHFDRMELTMAEIHKALKPGGRMLFAENLASSFIHQYARKRFVSWGSEWHYLNQLEMFMLLDPFSEYHTKSYGFFGAFGRSEVSRRFLAGIDKGVDWLIPAGKRYIMGGVATK